MSYYSITIVEIVNSLPTISTNDLSIGALRCGYALVLVTILITDYYLKKDRRIRIIRFI